MDYLPSLPHVLSCRMVVDGLRYRLVEKLSVGILPEEYPVSQEIDESMFDAKKTESTSVVCRGCGRCKVRGTRLGC